MSYSVLRPSSSNYAKNDEFRRFLDNLNGRMRVGLVNALEEGAAKLANAIQAAAPADTGRLRQSVRTKSDTARPNPRVFVRAGGGLTQPGDYDYANATEFGTHRQPARPFFYPTVRAMKADILRGLDKRMRESMEFERRSPIPGAGLVRLITRR